MELYYPWQLQAEGTIRDTKKGAGKNMVQAGAPKQIWDDTLDFEAYVRSHTALDVYVLQVQVPKTVMLGGNFDISQFCEHGFYDWFMFRDEPIQYPDENPVLGRYLVPAIDVGPETKANITQANIEVVHCSAYPGIKKDENTNQAYKSLRKDCDKIIKEIFWPDMSPYDFSDGNQQDIPLYDIYQDDTTDTEGFWDDKSEYDEVPVMDTGQDRQVPTPEVNHNNVNYSVMFPRGNTYDRGKVIGRKIYASGNAVGRMNDNPILDTREYFFELDGGEVSKLTANVIAESMYTVCDDYGNDYLIMDWIVDYQNNDKAVVSPDQKVAHRGWIFMRQSTVGYQLCV